MKKEHYECGHQVNLANWVFPNINKSAITWVYKTFEILFLQQNSKWPAPPWFWNRLWNVPWRSGCRIKETFPTMQLSKWQWNALKRRFIIYIYIYIFVVPDRIDSRSNFQLNSFLCFANKGFVMCPTHILPNSNICTDSMIIQEIFENKIP